MVGNMATESIKKNLIIVYSQHSYFWAIWLFLWLPWLLHGNESSTPPFSRLCLRRKIDSKSYESEINFAFERAHALGATFWGSPKGRRTHVLAVQPAGGGIE